MSRILAFPHPLRASAVQHPALAKHQTTSAQHLNPSLRLHLFDPSNDEVTHRALDLAQQVNLAVARMEQEIELSIHRDRIRRDLSLHPCDA